MHKYLLYCLIALLLCSACEEQVDIPLGDEDVARLVVNGRFTNKKKVHQIYIRRSTSYYYNEAPPGETGAVVSISSENEEYVLQENPSTPGLYETAPNVGGTIGKTYTLDIQTQGEQYSATVEMDSIMEMDSVTYEYTYDATYDFGFYALKMYAHELKGVGNCYLFNVYINNVWDNDTLNETPIMSDDEEIDGIFLPGIEFYYLQHDDIVKDTNIINLELLSISEDEFNFIYAVLIETEFNTDLIGSMFSGPPANAPTNILNHTNDIEPVGFFSVASVTDYQLTVYKEHKEDTEE